VEDLTGIHGRDPVADETKVGGTYTCALTHKSSGKEGGREVYRIE